MFLTHRDDVADHEIFARRFGCRRVLHKGDRVFDAEQFLDGDGVVSLGPGLTAIPVPGHTRGSTALLVDDRWVFTGDHLWWSRARRALNAGRDVCWYSWREQTKSMAALAALSFESVLPGHGEKVKQPAEEMRKQIQELVDRMRRV